MYELDACGNRLLRIPRGWMPRCRPADPRRKHNVKKVLARVNERLGKKK